MTMDYAASRRAFLHSVGVGAAALGLQGTLHGQNPAIQGFEETPADPKSAKTWQPVSDRKIRVGIAGYGVCRFGASFGFQDHPNVEIVAVTDIQPKNCEALMKAVSCEKSYPCLEEMVKDDGIEAIFVATDAPSHARHCIESLKHGKHVMCAVPATYENIEEGHELYETVKKTGLKYQLAETSYFHAANHAMRELYKAGAFGRLVYSEGEYFHYNCQTIASYKDWRLGMPPQFYPTHSNAYYTGVTGKGFTAVSCVGFTNPLKYVGKDANRYGNPFSDEVALFETEEGGPSRMAVMWGVQGYHGEQGRVFGELGSYDYAHAGGTYKGKQKVEVSLERPPLPPGVPAGGHGGSHGLLMHDFIMAILEDRTPLCDVDQAMAMSVSGIVAHQSAMKGGERLPIPKFS